MTRPRDEQRPGPLPLGVRGAVGAKRQAARVGARIAAFFVIVGALWILLADRAIALLVPDAATLTQMQTLKGWAFVAATAVFLFLLVFREVRERLEQEDGFHRLAENAPDLIYRYRLGPTPGFEYVNRAALRLTGYTPEDHYGNAAWGSSMVHPDDVAEARGLLEDLTEEGRVPREIRWIRKDGEVIWFEHRTIPLFDDAGSLVAVEGIARDVTARKKAETEVLERLEFRRALLDASPVAIVSLDRDGTVLTWNSAAEEIFGWPEKEVLGRRYPIVPPEGTAEFERLVELIWDGGIIRRLELELQRKDGETVVVGLSAGPIHDTEGRTVGIMAALADITERHTAERTLAEERVLLSRIMETSPVGIVLLDPSGVMVFVNSFAEQLLGLTRSDPSDRTYNAPALGITALDGGPFPDEELPFKRVLATGHAVFGVRHALTVGDGRRVLVSVNAAPVRDDEGSITGVVALIEDITQRVADQAEREKAEAQLFQSQKLEAVGRLAGGIAHDFNNMLGIIMISAEMALPEATPGSSIEGDLEQILDAAKRSADLTRQILAFSRKQPASPRVVADLNRLISDQQMLQRLIGADVEIRLGLEEGLWSVFIDPSQIDQILTNLLVNARDAIAGSGFISIDTANTRLDQTQAREELPIEDGDFVLLAVTDSGSGMSPEVMAQMFEPFYTTKAPGEGTGLGLSTVYGIVKQNGGVIHAYSEKGFGTSFKIYLPRHVGPAEVVVEEVERASGGGETILVVEDEPVLLDLTRRSLEGAGYHALAAETPAKALSLAKEHPGPIHLLLTDVILPRMNGRELQGEVQLLRPGIRTLFMSGYPASAIAQRGVLDEDVDFIQKPFTMKLLAVKVRDVLDGRR